MHNTLITIKIIGYHEKKIKTLAEKINTILILEKEKIIKLKKLYFWYNPLIDIKKISKKGYFFLPKKKKKISMNRSPFIFKKSGETFIKKEVYSNIKFEVQSKTLFKKNMLNILLKDFYKEINLSNISLSLQVKKTVMVK